MKSCKLQVPRGRGEGGKKKKRTVSYKELKSSERGYGLKMYEKIVIDPAGMSSMETQLGEEKKGKHEWPARGPFPQGVGAHCLGLVAPNFFLCRQALSK